MNSVHDSAHGVSGRADERMTALHEVHAAPLHRFLLRLTLGDRQAAEDLLQETFLRAWRNLDRMPTEAESTRRWLFTVARRIAIDAARSRQVRPVEVGAVSITELATEDDHADRVVAVEVVRDALRRLSPRHRQVLLEVYVRERSTRQAAEILGIPEGTVKSRTHHALRALRALLGE